MKPKEFLVHKEIAVTVNGLTKITIAIEKSEGQVTDEHMTHVIDYAAYNQVVYELEKSRIDHVGKINFLTEENAKFRQAIDHITKGIPSEWAYAILKKERDDLKKENTRYEVALKSIACLERPELGTYEYWENTDKFRCIGTVMNDTQMARDALSPQEEGKSELP